MNKRSLVFLAVAIACAVAAVAIARKYLPARASGAGIPLARILIAARNLDYGDQIVVRAANTAPADANCSFVNWPKEYVIAGAITENEGLGTGIFRAAGRIVKHQPIQKDLLITDSEFIPVGYERALLEVEPNSLTYAKPGSRVDVFQQKAKPVLAIKCALVMPPPREVLEDRENAKVSKKDKADDRVYVLVRKEDGEKFLGVTSKVRVVLFPAQDKCDKGMEFVGVEVVVAPPDRDLLVKAEGMMKQKLWREAYEILTEINADNLDGREAQSLRTDLASCRSALALQSLDGARQALDRKEYDLCIRLCEDIGREYADMKDTVAEAAGLAAQATKGNEGLAKEREYRGDIDAMKALLESGNLPALEEQIAAFEKKYAQYAPPVALPGVQRTTIEYRDKLQEGQRDFKLMQSLFNYHMTQNDDQKAVEKLQEMKKKFADHPAVKKAEEKLRTEGLIP